MRILAHSPEDGRAFVLHDGRILLVRPPYSKGTLRVNEDVVERAIQHHGFFARSLDFSDWGSLVDYLKHEFLEFRRQQQSVPDSARIRALVRKAPKRVLIDYLNRIRSEMLPKERQAALEILTEMLEADALKSDPELHSQTVALLREAATSPVEPLPPLVEPDLVNTFPLAAAKYKADAIRELTSRVLREQQIFPLAA